MLFRYYIGLGLSCLVLLLLVCHVLGLFYGFCGKRPGNVYGEDCCNTGTGANWLVAAVYLTFLFSLVSLDLLESFAIPVELLGLVVFFYHSLHLHFVSPLKAKQELLLVVIFKLHGDTR